MVTAHLTGIEVNWHFRRSTSGQNIGFEVDLQVRVIAELALHTEEEAELRSISLCCKSYFPHRDKHTATQVPDVLLAFVCDHESLGCW